jgi:hypothetical protein
VPEVVVARNVDASSWTSIDPDDAAYIGQVVNTGVEIVIVALKPL